MTLRTHHWIYAVALAFTCDVSAQSRPFPQAANISYRAGTLKPTPRNAVPLESEVIAFYQRWRADYLTFLQASDLPANSATPQAFVNSNFGLKGLPAAQKYRSVSEGHGYGMLIAAFLAGYDHTDATHGDFDALYRYFKARPSRPDGSLPDRHPYLMAFEQTGGTLSALAADSPADASDSASDADMDIAYALLLAEKQWPAHSTGINYGAEALQAIQAIMAYDINRSAFTVKFGDAILEDSPLFNATRTSDFMTQHWHTFFSVTKDAKWEQVRSKTYEIEANVFANFAPKTGLMPDFLKKSGTPYHTRASAGPAPSKVVVNIYSPPAGKILEDKIGDGNWFYNACRTPWRLATDFLLNGDARAFSQLEVLNSWIQRATTPRLEVASGAARRTTALLAPGAVPDPARINAGYLLNGNPIHPGIADHGSCFNGPLAVSAMVGLGNQAWLDALWSNLLDGDSLDSDGKEEYFRATVKLLCMIVLSGNWWDPQPTPIP